MNRFSQLDIPADMVVSQKNNTLFVTRWNWDYQECLKFQKKAVSFIQANRDLRIYIFCNHPHCFTLGRANERGVKNLVDFDMSLSDSLSFPIHRIKRGGGLTFHYPGQWIFYPIVAVNTSFSLEDLMCEILKSVRSTLCQLTGSEDFITAKKLMGIWKEKRKVASIGVGLDRFVSYHGLALNLVRDEDMFNELKKVSPCGLNPKIYFCVDEFFSSDNLILKFNDCFKNTLLSKEFSL
ncbi:MAG: hypothetical protein N4A33_08750 [Bacteriovoracaceae bacterium]|jgi:lipoyl(octanoyl) transferase|nr:hypothetical protein [Bacteriovoracaceae bacterium]